MVGFGIGFETGNVGLGMRLKLKTLKFMYLLVLEELKMGDYALILVVRDCWDLRVCEELP